MDILPILELLKDNLIFTLIISILLLGLVATILDFLAVLFRGHKKSKTMLINPLEELINRNCDLICYQDENKEVYWEVIEHFSEEPFNRSIGKDRSAKKALLKAFG